MAVANDRIKRTESALDEAKQRVQELHELRQAEATQQVTVAPVAPAPEPDTTSTTTTPPPSACPPPPPPPPPPVVKSAPGPLKIVKKEHPVEQEPQSSQKTLTEDKSQTALIEEIRKGVKLKHREQDSTNSESKRPPPPGAAREFGNLGAMAAGTKEHSFFFFFLIML